MRLPNIPGVRPSGGLKAADWWKISSGESTMCGIKLDQTLWCWGLNAGSFGNHVDNVATEQYGTQQGVDRPGLIPTKPPHKTVIHKPMPSPALRKLKSYSDCNVEWGAR